MLRAFKQPFADVRVLIVGQDPYPTPGHAVGLSFSVAPGVRPLPPSLVNIFREYADDLGYPAPANGDLTPWTERGVLLLNRVLTVQPGQPGSHRGKGWEEVTEQAIRALAARRRGGRWWRSCGAGTPEPGAATGRRRRDRVRSSESACRPTAASRLPPVQPSERVAGVAGRRPVDWKLP